MLIIRSEVLSSGSIEIFVRNPIHLALLLLFTLSSIIVHNKLLVIRSISYHSPQQQQYGNSLGERDLCCCWAALFAHLAGFCSAAVPLDTNLKNFKLSYCTSSHRLFLSIFCRTWSCTQFNEFALFAFFFSPPLRRYPFYMLIS